jgi:tRNA-2-methylthio-N6-dimethylallyladenosine synthase
VDEIGFDGLFVFMYSPRPGTTAMRQPDDVPDEEKLRRLQVLNHRQQRAQAERNLARIGSRVEVLVEEAGERSFGRTPDFKIVHLEGLARVGDLVTAEVVAAGANSLQARLVSANNSLTESCAVPIL